MRKRMRDRIRSTNALLSSVWLPETRCATSFEDLTIAPLILGDDGFHRLVGFIRTDTVNHCYRTPGRQGAVDKLRGVESHSGKLSAPCRRRGASIPLSDQSSHQTAVSVMFYGQSSSNQGLLRVCRWQGDFDNMPVRVQAIASGNMFIQSCV
jgi:hypothetical protein